mgnify:CR=1 FL=1
MASTPGLATAETGQKVTRLAPATSNITKDEARKTSLKGLLAIPESLSHDGLDPKNAPLQAENVFCALSYWRLHRLSPMGPEQATTLPVNPQAGVLSNERHINPTKRSPHRAL